MGGRRHQWAAVRDAEELAHTARTFHARWDQLLAAGYTDHQIRDMTLPKDYPPVKAADIPYPRNPHQAQGQAMRDVDTIVCDVRDLDPADVWREISRWTPTRLATAFIAACAALDRDVSLEDALDWVRDLDPTVATPITTRREA
ncbi:hypothetical protein SEA_SMOKINGBUNNY_57 [Gordonia phage SmokingBunny]|uniref:Uncharacterized protein n=1 Tax=Gordonia phage SmokingBunny TaxID=2572528 RepID=A0A4D6T706_9CAUD|nr:hypothetical protein KNU53_gp57 [Gordonia phage SmokingBunny]QCG77868.1 hypothetical protein SEA_SMOKINGBUNNY_57 [Gordonia phage SmokingBunny]WAA20274.1 hypothetical protein SEA_TOGO_56 [Gordonia phage Togo]